MKKILMITTFEYPSNSCNATQIRFKNLIEGFNKNRYVVVIISSNNKLRCIKENLKKNIINFKIPYINIKFVRKILFSLFLMIYGRKILKLYNPSIVYVNNHLTSLFVRKIKRIPIIWDIMGVESLEKIRVKRNFLNNLIALYFKINERILSNNVTIILTVNEAHRKIIKTFSEKPIYVIRDAIKKNDYKIFYHKKESKNINILFFGSLTNNRLSNLISIAPSLLKTKIKISIYGDGPYKSMFVKECKNNGTLNKNIFFKGYVSHKKIPMLLRNATICYSDDWSQIGFPVKVFEYMAAGKAVIVEDTKAVREIIKENYNGLLYEDKNDLLNKIFLLAKNKKLREKLGRNARKDVLKNHIWDKRKEQLNEILKNETLN